MLPPTISQYLPHVGILFLLIGVIFGIISAIDYPDKVTDITASNNYARFYQLSTVFIATGGFLLLGPIR